LTFDPRELHRDLSEAQRRDMHAELVKKLGATVADTLMVYLPPTGWADVARRSDLDHVEQVLRLEIQATHTVMQAMESRLEAKIDRTASSLMRWFMASQLVLVAATIGSITTIAN
jgi:hypothetical protein